MLGLHLPTAATLQIMGSGPPKESGFDKIEAAIKRVLSEDQNNKQRAALFFAH